MQHVKDQHIVPQFLLKNFSQDRLKIWTFDKNAINERWPNVKLRPIESTPTEEYIYDKKKGSSTDSIEYLLRDIEDQASPIIQLINKTLDLNRITPNDKLIVAWFITSQLNRTKGAISQVESINEQLTTFLKGHGHNLDSFDISSAWLNNLENSDQYVEYLLNKKWCLITSNNEFFISDNPVVLNNTTNVNQHRSTIGLDCKGIEIYLPISSSVVLCLFCPDTFKYENVVLRIESKHIEYVNWLQAKYATRFIYSYTSDFELITDMIDKDAL